MHWRKLVDGCRLYHARGQFDGKYLAFRVLPSREEVTSEMAKDLIGFINSWRTRSRMSPSGLRSRMLGAYSDLSALADTRIEDLDVEKPTEDGHKIGDAISRTFDAVAECAGRREATGASKVLHALLPHLFIMWDKRIAGGYGLSEERTGHDYAYRFLPRVAVEMEEAIATYGAECGGGRAQVATALTARRDAGALWQNCSTSTTTSNSRSRQMNSGEGSRQVSGGS